MYSEERKRSPEQFILAGFPTHDNLNPELKTHKTNLPTPDIGRSGRVLLPQLNPYSQKSRVIQDSFSRNYTAFYNGIASSDNQRHPFLIAGCP